jgi:iron complex outermembrane receptor protein
MSRITKRRTRLAVSINLLSIASLAGLGGPGLVFGQERDGPEIEEVVVNARRREEVSQNIPISMSAFSAADMKVMSMDQGRDIGMMVPNLVMGAGSLGQQDSSLRIRGVPGVGVYLDGIWQGNRGVLQTNLVDMQRVEVLRGPQGTLFGRNTNGGAIQYISELPGEEFSSNVMVGAGNFERRDIKASVDLPLSPTIQTRWTAARFERDGYLRSLSTYDPDGKRYDDRNDTFLRGDILWTPTEDLSVRFTSFDARQQNTEGRQVRFSQQVGAEWYRNVHLKAINWLMAERPGMYPSPSYSPEYYEPQWPGGEVGKWDTKAKQPDDSLTNHARDNTLRVNWDINENLAFQSLTAYRREDAHQLSLQDGADFVACCRDNRYYEDELFSEEIHLTGSLFDDSLTFLLGGYYSDAENKTRLYRWWMTEWFVPEDKDNNGNPDLNTALINQVRAYGASIGDASLARYSPLTNWFAENNRWTRTTEKEKAIFGEIDYSINSKWSINLGMRWSWRDVVDTQFRPGPNDARPVFTGRTVNSPTEKYEIGRGDMWAGTVIPPARPGINVVNIDASFTPKVSLRYQFNDDIMFYGTYSEGFSEGGITYVSALDKLFTLDPEIVESTEFGIKAYFLDRSVRFNSSVFYSKWLNLRVTRHPNDPNTGLQLPTPFQTDDGSAEVSGWETEILWLVNNELRLNLNAGYLKSKYIEIGDVGVTTLAFGAPFAYAPEWSYSVGAQYDLPLSNGADMTFRADYGWKDDYERDAAVTRQSNSPEPAYGLLNAQIRYNKVVPNGEWAVALYGTNLTDKRYVDGGFVSAGLGVSLDTVGPPREYGINLEYNF